jgi:hypothetical protein
MIALQAVLAFFKSPLGRYLLIGLAVLGAVLVVRSHWIGVGVQRERAASGKALQLSANNLATCRSNGAALQASLDSQNAAALVVQAESDRKIAQATEDLTQALKGRASAETKASRLLTHPPAGIDACARSMAAFAAVQETVQ